MVKHNFRLKIKNQLDKRNSLLGFQCVANEVIESNLERWLSVLIDSECQIPRVICLISNQYMKSKININLNSSSRLELSSLKSCYDVCWSLRPQTTHQKNLFMLARFNTKALDLQFVTSRDRSQNDLYSYLLS